MKPDGATGDETGMEVRKPKRRYVVLDEKWAARTWTVGAALGTARFWLMGSNIFLGVVTNQMLWAHQAAYLVDRGYDKMLAASLVGFAGLLSMPSKITWGVVSDRIGRELAYSLGMVSMLLAILVLVLVGTIPSVGLVILFAFLFAAGYAVSAPIGPAAAGDIFAGRYFGSIFGVMNMGMGLGGALGAWLAGFVFDLSGSYVLAFGVAASSSLASGVAIWLVAPRRVRRAVVTR